MRNNEFKTDDGFVFQDIRTNYFDTLESITESVDLSNNAGAIESFFTMSISISDVKSTYSRSYLKLQNMLADIGGVLKGVLMIAYFIEHCLINPL